MQTLTHPNLLAPFHLTDDSPLTLPDLDIIHKEGPTRWAITQESLIWQDERLDWPRLPDLLRATILTDAIEVLEGVRLRYAIPFRHLGRVITFALLPRAPEPIRVRAAATAPPPALPEPQDLDPPVPFLALGLASKEVAALHGRAIREFLRGDSQAISKRLFHILVELGKEGRITQSEAYYYLLSMRALASGSWRQMEQYFGLMELEQVVARAGGGPAQAQMLAYGHLVEGRPLVSG